MRRLGPGCPLPVVSRRWETLPRSLLVLACLFLLAAEALAQYGETITVARILIDVRVTDRVGNPIPNLTPEDFDVRLGGKNAKVESVTWVDESPSLQVGEENQAEPLDDLATRRLARLFVVFVQTDSARNEARVRGQMHFHHFADQIIDALQPEDRVAVFSFDSHLKFRLDFTSNKSRVQTAMREAMLTNSPPWPQLVHNPSLGSRLDPQELRSAPDSETALIHIANALRPIAGPKTLLLLGWGLGERSGSFIVMRPKWPVARQALEASRVSIFVLDTIEADGHDLEVGLRTAAKETGGFYAKTHNFPKLAIDRLQRTLSGHYELELRRPEALKTGTHTLEVRVKKKKKSAEVLAPSSWRDR